MIKATIKLLICLFLITGCGDGDECPDFNENDFILEFLDEEANVPGKISIFFKVDNKDNIPVAGISEADFTVYEKGRNDDCYNEISITESNARISPSSQIFSYNTILVLDLSGSVVSNNLEQLKDASTTFIESIMPETPSESFRLGIWWFDGKNQLNQLSDFTSSSSDLKTLVNSINSTISNDKSTDLYGAVIKSEIIASTTLTNFQSKNIISASSVVIFTDGTDQAGRHLKTDAISSVNSADKKITFYTIGLGDEIDEDVLEEIGKTTSQVAKKIDDLEETFLDISGLVTDEANSYYLFEYCTPKRDGSGMSDLVIEYKDGRKSGSNSWSFDATGFDSGCQ